MNIERLEKMLDESPVQDPVGSFVAGLRMALLFPDWAQELMNEIGTDEETDIALAAIKEYLQE